MREYPAILNDSSFLVMLDNQLTSYDNDVLDRLYLPIIGDKAISILKSFYSLVKEGEKESRIYALMSALKVFSVTKDEYVEAIDKLEAIGLIDCYFKDDTFVYVLKRVLYASEFFNDDSLVFLLIEKLGKQEVDNLSYDFLLRRIDITNYEKITKPFNEVFFVVDEDNNLNCKGVDTYSNGITISKDTFNLDLFMIMMDSLDIVDQHVYKSNAFVNQIVRYAYLYQLSPEVLKDCVVQAAKTDKTVDMKKLSDIVKVAYDKKLKPSKVVYRKEVVKSDDPRVKMFEEKNPSEIVRTKYKTPLLASEIAMFDDILNQTGINKGILNVLILYVMDQLDGQIPSKNYFLKVLNTWIREGIDTTTKAIEMLQGKKPKRSRGKYNKPAAETPEWFKQREKEELERQSAKKAKKAEEIEPEDDKSLEDLIKFFDK